MVGNGAAGPASQGWSVALSADGNTAVVGGPDDNLSPDNTGGVGAAWIFTRGGGTWSQQGNKLVGTGAVGNSQQGFSVAISGDGNTVIVGGPGDSTRTGFGQRQRGSGRRSLDLHQERYLYGASKAAS